MTDFVTFIGTAIFPTAGQVETAVAYGPTGADYTGTLEPGGGLNVNVQAAVVSVVRGASIGWFEYLFAGDAYTTENGRAYEVTINDSAGNVLTALGSTAFSAAAFRADVRGGDGTADFVGTMTWSAISESFVLEFTTTELDKAVPGVQYTGQVILWPDTADQTTVDEVCFEAV